MYNALSIRRLRGIDKLDFTRLARVNILTGENGIGKSTVLEAFWLHSNPYASNLLVHADAFRGIPWKTVESGRSVAPWRHMFYKLDDSQPIEIAGQYDQRRWTLEMVDTPLSAPVAMESVGQAYGVQQRFAASNAGPLTALRVACVMDGEEPVSTALIVLSDGTVHALPVPRPAPVNASLVAPPQTRGSAAIAESLGNVIRAKRLNEVLDVLRVIAPQVTDLVSLPLTAGAGGSVVYADVGEQEMLPAAALGDGFLTVLHYATLVVNAGPSVLLIDEVGAGVYHSRLEDVWRSLFELCRRFDVQVVATTHSLECIEAAKRGIPDDDLLIHRLSRDRAGRVVLATLDARLLRAAEDIGLEVR